MEKFITDVINNITSFMSSFGFLSGFLLIILESIIPVLPLSAFILINTLTYGKTIGIIISWVATIIGCMISFFVVRKLKYKIIKKNKEKFEKISKKLNNVSFSNLTLILTIPFTPAFAINIGAALSDISAKKYFLALIIAKLPMVCFWAFIGKGFIDSLTDIKVLIKIGIMLLITYLISVLVKKIVKWV